MTPERLAEILAIAKCATDEGYDLSRREMRELLDAIEAAQSRIAQLEAQRGGAVVVPTKMPTSAMDAICYPRSNGVSQIMQAAWGACRAAAQAIPADQVLADGMVGVDREELALYRQWESDARDAPDSDIWTDEGRILAKLSALRSAKGEVEG